MENITLRKFLVTLDGSEVAESVLPYLKDLAPRFNAHVDALGTVMGRGDRRVNRLLEDYISRIATSLRDDGIEVEPVILYGSAADKILDYAAKNDIDLIIMATHGRSGLSRWWMGSVAEKVVSAAKTPVLLIPGKKLEKTETRGRLPILKIVVPLDGSDIGRTALPYAETLAKQTGASISLIQVIPSPGAMDPSIPGGSYWIKYVETVNDTARDYLSGIAKNLTRKGIKATCEVVTGDPAYKIVDYAENEKADLIAMSTHGRTGIARWVLGSVTDKVLHGAKVPVWIVRPSQMVISKPKD